MEEVRKQEAEPAVTAQRLDGVRFEFPVASSAWLTRDRSAEQIMWRYIVIFTLCLTRALSSDEPEWCSPDQVQRIALASIIAEYPLRQGDLRDAVGIPKVPALWGSGDERGTFNIAALTNPEGASGYYAVRITYQDTVPLPAPADLKVLSVEVLFIGHGKLVFAYEPSRGYKNLLPAIREDMKKTGKTPRQIAEQFYPSK